MTLPSSVGHAGRELHHGDASRVSENSPAAAWNDAMVHARAAPRDVDVSPARAGNDATTNDKLAATDVENLLATLGHDAARFASAAAHFLDPAAVKGPPPAKKTEPTKAAVEKARLHIASEMVRKAGHATKADEEVLEHHLASTLSLSELRKMKSIGVHFVVVRGSVADYGHGLTGHPRGYPPGATWKNVAAVTITENGAATSVISTHAGPNGQRELPGPQQTPSTDATLHEAGHAINAIRGYPGLLSDRQAFRTAYHDDANKGPLANPYYHQAGSAGRDEAFAESNAEYLRHPQWMKKEYPHLYAYFHHLYGGSK